MLTKYKYPIIIILFLINILGFWYINLRVYTIDKIEIPHARLAETLKDLTIVHISDMHIRRDGIYSHRIQKSINSLEPDILFVTGDLIKGPEKIDEALEFFSHVKSRFGIFYVPGNYDHTYADLNKVLDLFDGLQRLGVHVLFNRSLRCTVIRDGQTRSFYISGIDDLVTFHDDIDDALSGCTEDLPAILLSHSPKIFKKAVAHDVDVVLSGHTHGGQIYIPYITQRLTRKYFIGSYLKGYHYTQGTHIFINRGLGASLVPVRLFALPQIAVLEFT
ncbi:MAG: hypothetical protein GF307_12020 [candidate division Zixibacteria bacterium]|nr:hypothetical protein [candidate division Zixibacteria bacterium]